MENNVAFLASDVGRLFRKRFELATRDIGVTGPQWRALARIQAHPGINQGALASFLEVEAITAGRMVDRLEKMGLVERRPAANDRRVWLLHLTDRAGPLLAELRDRAGAIITQTTDVFTAQELALFVSFLERVRGELLGPCIEACAPPRAGAPTDRTVELAAHG